MFRRGRPKAQTGCWMTLAYFLLLVPVSASVFGEPPPRPPASTPRWQGLEQDVRLKGRAGKRVCAACFKGRMVGAGGGACRPRHPPSCKPRLGNRVGASGRPSPSRLPKNDRRCGTSEPARHGEREDRRLRARSGLQAPRVSEDLRFIVTFVQT